MLGGKQRLLRDPRDPCGKVFCESWSPNRRPRKHEEPACFDRAMYFETRFVRRDYRIIGRTQPAVVISNNGRVSDSHVGSTRGESRGCTALATGTWNGSDDSRLTL